MSLQRPISPDTSNAQHGDGATARGELLVICLCAEWCGTCREYQTAFEELAAAFPSARFLWLDIEDHADDLGDLDIENFPTLLIQRRELVLFFGTMLPHIGHLARLVETYQDQAYEESERYALANDERRGWQANVDFAALREMAAR